MPKKISLHVLWPGGNTTALITEKFPRTEHFKIARQILNDNKDIEQVGFLEQPEHPEADIRLQMMGGEFCGNATRAAVFFWAGQNHRKSVKIEVSGFPEVLTAKINNYSVQLELPGSFFSGIEHPETNSPANYSASVPNSPGPKNSKPLIVNLMGIKFIIKNSGKSLAEARKLIEKYQEDFPAVGVLYVDPTPASITAHSSTSPHSPTPKHRPTPPTISIDPIVWVRETNTCYNETACGSGSIAAAIVAYTSNPSRKTFSILQPSGEIYTITFKTSKNQIQSIIFEGTVKYLGEREVRF